MSLFTAYELTGLGSGTLLTGILCKYPYPIPHPKLLNKNIIIISTHCIVILIIITF